MKIINRMNCTQHNNMLIFTEWLLANCCTFMTHCLIIFAARTRIWTRNKEDRTVSNSSRSLLLSLINTTSDIQILLIQVIWATVFVLLSEFCTVFFCSIQFLVPLLITLICNTVHVETARHSVVESLCTCFFTLFISRLEDTTKLIHKDTKKCIECQAGWLWYFFVS